MTRPAWGIGLSTITLTDDESVLDTWYPAPKLGDAPEGVEDLPEFYRVRELERFDETRGIRLRTVMTTVDLDEPPTDSADAYLRLHLLSLRIVEPNSINLDGIFAALPNIVWTDLGSCAPDGFDQTRQRMMKGGRAAIVLSVDKFPRMADFVMPSGVRIADAARVRLGAYLAEGTTVMHEGFVNFNAGTLGPSMVEGRISQGVVVGPGSDLGGGASIMGTLSGGGKEKVRVGERSLLGANAGLGISLGDDCVVEAGLYLTAGTKIAVADDAGGQRVVKAIELSGQSNLLFRRNSISGTVEAVARDGSTVELNAALHAN